MPDQESTAVDPDALRTALARGSRSAVAMRETHISWVLLSGDRAYKLKKPLVLPFLDYGTADRRRAMCAEEVRLGRRLAHDLYLGVRGVRPAGDNFELTDAEDPVAVDYVVEMRRYDEERTLAATLGRGELRRRDVDRVAEVLAVFHRGCPPAPRRGGAWRVHGEVMRNVEELLPVAAGRVERERVHELAALLRAYLASHAAAFDERAAGGAVRDVHGDLRAEHIILGREIEVVDCVEFDTALRTLDVADDLAFLVMDLAALGGERFGAELLAAYRGYGGDCGDDHLVVFYAVHRALVRAKVLLVRAAQHPPGSAAHGHAAVAARDLLMLADRFGWRLRRPLVIVVCGVPASGKSLLAAALAERGHLTRISSDLVRKRLARIRPTVRASAGYYRDDVSLATYRELGRRAAAEVARDGAAIIDATCRRRRDRDAFREAFGDAAPLAFVRCTASGAVLAARAIHRAADPRRVSDATLEVVLRERHRFEALAEVTPDRQVTVDTDRPVEAIVQDVVAALDRLV